MGIHKGKWPLMELSSKAVLKKKHLLTYLLRYICMCKCMYKFRYISARYLVLSTVDCRCSIVTWNFKSSKTDSWEIYKILRSARQKSDSPICWAVYGIRGKGRGELISNVKLMTGWKQGSEPLILNIQTTDGSDRLTITSDQGRSWEADHSS